MSKTWLFGLPYHPIVHLLEALACGTCRSCDHKHDKLPLSLVLLQVKRTSYTSNSPVKLRMWFITSLAYFVNLSMWGRLVAPWKTELLSTVLMSATRGTLLLLDIPGNWVTLLTIYLSVMCIDKPPKSDTTMRRNLEKYWIIKLQTSQPSGINIKD